VFQLWCSSAQGLGPLHSHCASELPHQSSSHSHHECMPPAHIHDISTRGQAVQSRQIKLIGTATMPARHEHSHRRRDMSFQRTDRHKACKRASDAERHWAVLKIQQDMLHTRVGSVTDLRLSHFSKVVFLRAIGSLALAHELDSVHHGWQVAQQVLHQVAGLVSSLCHTMCIRPGNSCCHKLLKQQILYRQSCLFGSCSCMS